MTSTEHRASLSSASDFSPVSPLIWWRTRKPTILLTRSIGKIREALLETDINGDPDWFRAILGNAPVAIRIAVEQLKANRITAIEIDFALSAVLACALEGEPTSAIVISSTLRRRAKCDPPCKILSLLWLATNFKSREGAVVLKALRGRQ
ncbi:MAG: hypothetical protein ACTHNN_17460 [Xanthobacteraceae bacterium]